MWIDGGGKVSFGWWHAADGPVDMGFCPLWWNRKQSALYIYGWKVKVFSVWGEEFFKGDDGPLAQDIATVWVRADCRSLYAPFVHGSDGCGVFAPQRI
jgi:hypothetical protein